MLSSLMPVNFLGPSQVRSGSRGVATTS